MVLQLGDTAPDFTAETQQGTIKFHEYLGKSWGIFFSHPADYTPVCTTELGEVAKRSKDFADRNTKVIALSCDDVDSHKGWIKDIEETQNTKVDYPIIADKDRKIAVLYGMLDKNNKDKQGLPLTVRSVYIIDPNKVIRLILTYPASCGRNFDEIIRTLDSLQLTSYKQVATPVNWKKNEDVIVVPSLKDEDAKKIFGEIRIIKPYLRYTKYPGDPKPQ